MDLFKKFRFFSKKYVQFSFFMVKYKGKIYSREELMSGVWNYEYYGDLRAVDVAVRRLREKLEVFR